MNNDSKRVICERCNGKHCFSIYNDFRQCNRCGKVTELGITEINNCDYLSIGLDEDDVCDEREYTRHSPRNVKCTYVKKYHKVKRGVDFCRHDVLDGKNICLRCNPDD